MKKFIFVLVVLGLAIVSMAAIPWRWEYGTSDSMDAFMRDPQFPGMTLNGNLVLDDNYTNSPSLSFYDDGENDWAILKVDGATGNLTATSDAATSDFQIVTGNLKVGSGTEGTTLNGQDAYVTGTFEVDGAVALDNASLSIRAISYTWPSDNGDAGEQLQTNGSGVLSWESAGSGSGRTLDEAYDDGGSGEGDKINADSNAVEIEVAAQSNNGALILDNDDTNNLSVLLITNVATSTSGIAIDVDGQSTGRDFEGTGATSYIDGDGSILGLDLDVTGALGITLQNDATILNDTDNEIQFTDGAEDISFGFGTSNYLNITSDTGVDTVDWLDVDTHGGLNQLVFDAAAGAIALAADGAGDNLTIAVTGTQDAHLIMNSAGTSADAIRINASDGGLDLDAADGLDIDVAGASGEDITLTNSGGSIGLEATEAAADAIVLNASTAAGGIDITSNADIDITTTGAADEDISITNTGGSINIRANENNAAAIVIDTAGGGGTGEAINILNDQGTADDSIDLDSTAGGMDVDVAGSFTLTSTEGSADSIYIHSNGGGLDILAAASANTEDLDIGLTGAHEVSIDIDSAGTTTDAIILNASAGGIDVDAADDISIAVTAGATGEDLILQLIGAQDANVQILSAGTAADAIIANASAGGMDIDAASTIDIDAADDISLSVTAGATGEDLVLELIGAQDANIALLSAGTAVDAIRANATAGGIDIDAAGVIDIDAADDISLSVTAGATGEDLVLELIGAQDANIALLSAGTAVDSIRAVASAGGISLTADGATGAGIITMPSLVCLGTAPSLADDATPDVSGSSFWETGGTTTITGFDTGGGTITEGTVLIIKVKHSLTFDVTSSNLTGGTTDITGADGDTLLFIYDGESKFTLISFMDMSDDLS